MPISEDEVLNAVKKMKHGKAPGRDEIHAELIKYGPPIPITKITNLLNMSFDGSEDIEYGHGILVPLQKPGKAKGVAKNFRPIILLPVLRKILSLITIDRIKC